MGYSRRTNATIIVMDTTLDHLCTFYNRASFWGSGRAHRQTSSGEPKSPRIPVDFEDLCERLAAMAELESRTVATWRGC